MWSREWLQALDRLGRIGQRVHAIAHHATELLFVAPLCERDFRSCAVAVIESR
jgi:hypothetical protein